MNIIGLMSGTSLDGLDVALCRFGSSGAELSWELLAAETYPYDDNWTQRLASLDTASAYDYVWTHVRLGHYFGEKVRFFRREHAFPVDAIASHGHTIFHRPMGYSLSEKNGVECESIGGGMPKCGMTAQIGDGNAIFAETMLPVVSNFRALDVAFGGQGAPLVPIGDRLLFPDYEACLNLGGFSNISYDDAMGIRRAFDISPCNFALNALSHRVGAAFDRDGLLAATGVVNEVLLNDLDALEYYHRPLPKSLGKEWFLSSFSPLLEASADTVPNLLRTVVEHIARQVSFVVKESGVQSMLVTGGGAHNAYLISRITALLPDCSVMVPSRQVVDYKEAIIFALLGYLRLQGQSNCLASVTGASMDVCGGDVVGWKSVVQS